MSYGRISSAQWKAIQPFVRGKIVHDLGAGDLTHSTALLLRGAKKVIAVDKELVRTTNPDIKFVHCYYHQYQDPTDISFVAWPINHERNGLAPLLAKSRIVIYIGKNTDGAACGSADMFEHLTTREVLAYLPEMPNTLIIYGPETVEREMFGEERAALNSDHVWRFNEIERGQSA